MSCQRVTKSQIHCSRKNIFARTSGKAPNAGSRFPRQQMKADRKFMLKNRLKIKKVVTLNRRRATVQWKQTRINIEIKRQ